MTMQECAHCGDVLPRDGSYCGACGAPAPARRPPGGARHAAGARPAWPRALAPALATTALVAVLAAALSARPAAEAPSAAAVQAAAPAGPAPAPESGKPAEPATASAPASAPTAPPAAAPAAVPDTSPVTPPAAAPAAPPATPSATAPSSAAADTGLTPAQALAFAAAWFDAGAEAQDAAAVRDFYADSVAYYQRGQLGWAAIAEDKRAYLARWPKRRYQLLSVQLLDGADTGGAVRAALHFSWHVTRDDGRYRRGQAVTQLTLQRQDGRIRIVAERTGT